jgi:malonate-semialdehyde dehydrogenase (acetylating)/methylmalonate-semialdehyde dehydrogenase
MVILEEPIKEVLELKNYINGEWVESKSKERWDVINPATRKLLAKVPMSTKDEVNAKVEA